MSCVWHPPFGQLIYSGSGIFLFGTYLFGNLSFWFGHLFVWHLPFGQLITLIWASFCWVLPIWQLITLFLAPFLLGSTYLATNYSAFGTFLFFFWQLVFWHPLLVCFWHLFVWHPPFGHLITQFWHLFVGFYQFGTYWLQIWHPFFWQLAFWHLVTSFLAPN